MEPTDVLDNKPFTPAQNDELRRLLSDYQFAQANLERFVNYLRREYDAPAEEGWTGLDVKLGFVRHGETNGAVQGPVHVGAELLH